MSFRFALVLLPALLTACRPESADSEKSGEDTAPVDADDCDGEGVLSTFYADADADGFGDPEAATRQCAPPEGHTTDATDCDDTDPSVNPEAAERWYDDVDQDCDGASDYDQDADGHDSSAHGGTDCDDRDPLSYADEGACRCLEGWWPFDEESGTTTADLSGNGHDGLIEGDPSRISGAVGGALELDGDGDFVDMGNVLDLPLPVTIAAWVWVESDNFIFVTTDDANSHYSGFYLQVYQDHFWASFGDGTGLGSDARRSIRTNAEVERGAWQHLAVVFRGGVDADVYVDGAPAASVYDGSGGSLASSSSPFRIGRFSYGGERVDAQGAIDEVRVYRCDLDEDEIAAIVAR